MGISVESLQLDLYPSNDRKPRPYSSSNARATLHSKYAEKLVVNPELTRALVSFQANKNRPFYRWLKYKEAFSSDFVRYVLDKFKPSSTDSIPCVLDPFAGAGTTLTTATKMGWQAVGVELLPVGTAAIRARLLADTVNIKSFRYFLNKLKDNPLDSPESKRFNFPHLRITEQAFPKSTEQEISLYIAFLNEIRNEEVRYLFWFACLSILEEVSYTRKDGQYLRWDFRSGRPLKSTFDKGPILDFKPAIVGKLNIMLEDIEKRNGGTFSKNVKLIEGSSLKELSSLASASTDLVVTSPPYCNRYDYTRTYALELAFMGHNDEKVKELRQTLLSATVENKTKQQQLANEYRYRNQEKRFNATLDAFNNQKALHEVLNILYCAGEKGELNNNNIPTLVENYFFEMNIIIHELSRVLKPGGKVIMVNDNVQYHGEEIPVDLILSDFATKAGLTVNQIWVLSRGKGNSSQQMGIHGRNEIRKCVYVWSKPFEK